MLVSLICMSAGKSLGLNILSGSSDYKPRCIWQSDPTFLYLCLASGATTTRFYYPFFLWESLVSEQDKAKEISSTYCMYCAPTDKNFGCPRTDREGRTHWHQWPPLASKKTSFLVYRYISFIDYLVQLITIQSFLKDHPFGHKNVVCLTDGLWWQDQLFEM